MPITEAFQKLNKDDNVPLGFIMPLMRSAGLNFYRWLDQATTLPALIFGINNSNILLLYIQILYYDFQTVLSLSKGGQFELEVRQ